MFTIHRGNLITTLVDARNHLRYTIESRVVRGQETASIRSVAQSYSTMSDAPDFWYEEIARVEWGSPATFVSFGRRRVNINSYLRSGRRFSNSRTFTGPSGELFRWKVKGNGLELYDESSRAVIACLHAPHQTTDHLFSMKHSAASLEVSPEYSKLPQLLDEIVVTWVILDGIMHNKDINGFTGAV